MLQKYFDVIKMFVVLARLQNKSALGEINAKNKLINCFSEFWSLFYILEIAIYVTWQCLKSEETIRLRCFHRE